MATPVSSPSSPGFDAPNDTTLARALADCSHCLSTYLLALDRAPHAMTCPGCASVWSVSHAERPVDVPADLEALARWLPTICGRAVTYGGIGGGAPRHGERPDAVDERHRDRRSGLRTALGALSTLDAMERAGEARHVRVLWAAYVIAGPEVALRTGLEMLVGWQFATPTQRNHWATHKSAKARDARVRDVGERLLAGARAAYEGAVRRNLRLAPTAHTTASTPDAIHALRAIDHELGALIGRTLARVGSPEAKVGNDSSKVGNENRGET